MAKKKYLSETEQHAVVMSFLRTLFTTPYWGYRNLTKDTRFNEDLEVSDLDVVMLIHDAKEEFGVSLSDDDIGEIRTFDDFAKKIIFYKKKLMKKDELIKLAAEKQYAAVQDVIVERLINHYYVDAEAISPASSFKEDLGLDSLDYVELVMHIEKTTDLRVADREVDHQKDTVDSLTNVFVQHISQ